MNLGTALLILLSLVLPFGLAAQRTVPPPPFLTKTLDSVTAVLDPESGRFSVRHADGRSILFFKPEGLTSHVSVRIGTRTYSNFRWILTNTDPRVQNLGKGTAEVLTDRLRYTWVIKNWEGEHTVVQELIPVRDGDWNEVRVQLSVENRSAKQVPIGMTLVMDLDAAGNDNAPIRVGETVVRYEREFRGGEVPDSWSIDDDALNPHRIAGRLTGDGLTTPDAFIPGGWYSHGYLGRAVYGYTASGLYLWDAGVFLQWDTVRTAPGARREATAAVGLHGRVGSTKDDTPNGTFAREVWMRRNTSSPFFLVSDSTVLVTITSICDAVYESEATKDDRWDTTVVVQPDVPTRILYEGRFCVSKDDMDSLRWYQQQMVRFKGDRPFAVVSNHPSLTSRPESWSADTSFLLPGDFSGSAYYIISLGEETELSVTPRNKALQITNYQPFRSHLRMTPDSTYRWKIPPRSVQLMGLANGEQGYGYYVHPPASADGAGSLLKTDKPVMVLQWITARLINGFYFDLSRSLSFLPEKLLGRAYPFIPYKKTNAIRNHDFVRIVAHHDSTRLKLFDFSTPVLLHRGQSLDTLLDVPTVIEADKPFALYQHGLNYKIIGSLDTTRYGDSWQHLTPERWGRKYYPITNIWTQFRDMGRARDPYPEIGWSQTDTSHFFLRVVAHRDSVDGISLDGMPLSPAQFLSVGDFRYADIPYQKEYGLVQGRHRFLTLVYGWTRVIPASLNKTIQETQIPPFKE